MILIGQYDSSFVRRVGIALRLYRFDFEHRPWSVFSDAAALGAINPLGGVPVLVLDDGAVLVDSKMMLDHLDSLVSPTARLWPAPAQHLDARRITALATGLADRFISLFYERRLHDVASPILTARREGQIRATLTVLEAERRARPTDWLFGPDLTHADIALACTLRHLRDSAPDQFDANNLPALVSHASRAEALPVFQDISQAFVAPV